MEKRDKMGELAAGAGALGRSNLVRNGLENLEHAQHPAYGRGRRMPESMLSACLEVLSGRKPLTAGRLGGGGNGTQKGDSQI